MILICCRKYDEASKHIARKLKLKAGTKKVYVLFLDDLANTVHQKFLWDGSSLINCVGIELSKVRAIYYRLLLYPYLPNLKMETKYRDFLNRELGAFWFGQLLAIHNDLYWMNHPFYCHVADYKLLQVNAARGVGLNIPKTCISTNREVLFDFYHLLNTSGHEVISKAIYSGYIEGHNPEDEEYVLTQKVHLSQSSDLPQGSPVILQQYIKPEYEVRSFVVGNRVLSAKVTSRRQYEDYRVIDNDYLDVEKIQLPKSVQRSCLALTSRLKLHYSAIDLIYRNGKYVFIDFNPIGKWDWYEKRAGLPISDAIVDCLLQKV